MTGVCLEKIGLIPNASKVCFGKTQSARLNFVNTNIFASGLPRELATSASKTSIRFYIGEVIKLSHRFSLYFDPR